MASRHPLCWCHEKNADYCPQIDTTVLVVCGMLRRPLYCIIWAWLLHPTNESSSFCFWLFMPPKLSFVSWHWTFSRHLFGVLIRIFSSGVRRTIGLWIVDCCVIISFFWLHHQLENAFHLLFAGFDGQQDTQASCETFALTLLLIRMIACGQTEKMAAEVMPFLLMDSGGCSHSWRRLTVKSSAWFLP